MDAYIARQPIFDAKRQVAGYELLYRSAASPGQAQIMDGSAATCTLLSDALTLFDLSQLTNGKPAFVNFTDQLILNDFVLLTKPEEMVVELLEDVRVTDDLVAKLENLKARGYTLALDDYTGDPAFERILPLADILKVDFLLTTPKERAAIAQRCRQAGPVRLLAEKVETQEEFEVARSLGYQLFQGYFFAKPRTFQKPIPSLAVSSYGRVLAELQRTQPDLEKCARIIRSDAVLEYRMMQKVSSLAYYRGNAISGIQQALVMMGLDELRRWILLSLARDNNVSKSDELIAGSYLRGLFAERLMRHTSRARESESGFIMGMFSLLDKILGMSIQEVLSGVDLPEEIVQALLGRGDGFYTRLMQFIYVYEMGMLALKFPDIGLTIPEREVSRLYMECMVETDKTFQRI